MSEARHAPGPSTLEAIQQELIAQARLTAAAPDLLAMAIEARALLERGPDTTEAGREDVRRGLSDAITRATGSEQP